jgi:DNA-binding transcriptional ArsR family regulator
MELELTQVDLAPYVARARVLKALAHPVRLRFVDELARGEMCVCELNALVGQDGSTVSKHLSLLKAAGVVLDRKQGNQVYYRLRVPCILSFFGCVERVLREQAQEQLGAVSDLPEGAD